MADINKFIKEDTIETFKKSNIEFRSVKSHIADSIYRNKLEDETKIRLPDLFFNKNVLELKWTDRNLAISVIKKKSL